MNLNISPKYSNQESPYKLFSNDLFLSSRKNSIKTRNPHNKNIPRTSKTRTTYSTKKTSIRPMTTITRLPSAVSSISKSLKSVTLSSKLYSNYINYYSNITQDYTFKTPKVSNYPLLKNEKYLPITSHPSTAKERSKDKTSLSTEATNSIFLSYMKEIKSTKKKYIEEKPYGFKYGSTKIRFDRAKSANGYYAGKDFGDLCEHNLFETEYAKLISLKNIDMYNSNEERKKNFLFYNDYMKKIDEIKDIFNEFNFHRSIKFNGRTAIKKENMNFKLDIYSLCLKFFILDNTNKKNPSQKLYFPYELLPLFYLLDFTSFKVFLSEIITYDPSNKCFKYIKETIILKKVKRYFNYVTNSLEKNPKYINSITYNKNESIFPLIYDWVVAKNPNAEQDENNSNKNGIKENYICFKLKIVLPKIKFYIENLNIKIIKYLNKQMTSKLLLNKFRNWQKFIFFDLFSTKKFKIISNLVMLNKHNKIPTNKIYLNKKHKIQNKSLEFFITQIGENSSHFYIFTPYIIFMIFGEKNKKFQKIFLNLKESKNLIKFGKIWGVINTLFKCMCIDKLKNKIFFKFNSLEDEKDELYKIALDENSKQIIKSINNNNNVNMNNNLIKKISSKNTSLKDKDNFQTKFKDNMFEINLLNCTLLKISITSYKQENKYYKIPTNLLKLIFNTKDENKIFNTSCSELSIIAQCIGENSKNIISALESDIISEEQSILKKSKTKDEAHKFENINNESQNPRHQDAYNKIKTFQMFQNNTNLLKKEQKKVTKREIKKEIKIEPVNKKSIGNNKISFELINGHTNYSKKVAITDLNSLRKSRMEHGTLRDSSKKKVIMNNIF